MISPTAPEFSSKFPDQADHFSSQTDLRLASLSCLIESDARVKAKAVESLRLRYLAGQLNLDVDTILLAPEGVPGRPQKPDLVPPLGVKRRAMNTLEGRATLIHALTHIEFNAINLALDAIWRFPNMPQAYYADWLQVAQEEAYHFSLLADHLQVLGFAYGDFPAHNSLWELAERTQDDVLSRMALVPRTMEARGLDATPALRAKIAQAGDMAAAEILDIILRDEIGHVAIGNRWFAYLCEQRQLEPIACFSQLATQFRAPILRAPFNVPARLAAGFTQQELDAMQIA